MLYYAAIAGRLLNFTAEPFDCSFRHWHPSGKVSKAMLVLWYRSGLPVLIMGLYQLGLYVTHRNRPEQRSSKYRVNDRPPIVLIVLTVYQTYCIDAFVNFCRVLNCIDMSHSVHHHYTMYEVLESISVWSGDTSLICWTGMHAWSVMGASVGLFILVGTLIAIPKILRDGKKNNNLSDPRFMFKYGVLYLAYRRDGLALYWEAIIALRKMLTTTVGEFAKYREIPGVQLGLAGIVIFAFMILHQIILPFPHKDSSETFPSYAGSTLKFFCAHSLAARWVAFNKQVTYNGLEAASLHMSLSLFFTAASIADSRMHQGQGRGFLADACFCLNSFFVLFMLYRLWCGMHHYMDVIAKTRGIAFKDGDANGEAETYLLVKVWILARSKVVDDEERDADAGAGLT